MWFMVQNILQFIWYFLIILLRAYPLNSEVSQIKDGLWITWYIHFGHLQIFPVENEQSFSLCS